MALSPNFDLKDRLEAGFKDTTTLNSLCITIATEIDSGKIKLYTLMETLSSYMTDEDVFAREKGVRVLSSVLLQLPQDYLTEAELDLMTMFYCDKMKCYYNIVPFMLNGILAIVNMTHLPRHAPSSLLRILFQHVQCQAQLLPERRNIYLILKSLIDNKLDDLRPMGADLVYGIISFIDGERDPNNLILLFDTLLRFIKEFPLGHLAEEMFEVLACYFPVDFNPSGAEYLTVTRKDLAERLAPCLCATSEFADYCIPLIIDKLYSTLRVAKLDSLNLLRDSVQTFGLPKLQPHLPELWTTLRKEVMPGRDVEIKDVALEAITCLIRVISVDETVCKDFIDKIITDTKMSLCDVQLSLYKPAEKLLETIAAVNKATCVQILQIVIPLCIGQYSTKISSNDKILLIETLNNFMKICSNYEFCIQDVPELAWANVPQIYLDGLTIEDNELKSKMFLGLTIQKAYLNDVQRCALYNAICDEIEAGCDEIQIICHTTILDFAKLYLPEISLLVEERLLLDVGEMGVELLKRRIKALSAIAKIRELGCVILPKIVAMLTNDVDTNVRGTALLNIQKLLAPKNSDFNIYQFLYKECHIIDKLILYETNVVDHKILISNVCQLIVRNLAIEEQRAIVSKYAPVLNAEIVESNMAVIMNLLIPLRRDVRLDVNSNTIGNLYNLAISNHDSDIRQTTCKFLSVLLNKMEIIDLDWVVSCLEDKINLNLQADIDIELKQHTVDLQIWMTKALVMRRCEKSQKFLENLTCQFYDQMGRYVAQQYQVLVYKHEDTLITENFCDVRIFYKQRVFEHLLQQTANFKILMRQNYLIALVHLVEQMPEEILFLHLTELVPLLIQSLALRDEHLVLWTLRSLKLLLGTKQDVFSDNVQCVVPRLLQLSKHRIMRARIMALECLKHYASYPTILISPYKQTVLDNLGMIIDDRKRLVRKAAVEARIRWYMVGASGESKK